MTASRSLERNVRKKKRLLLQHRLLLILLLLLLLFFSHRSMFVCRYVRGSSLCDSDVSRDDHVLSHQQHFRYLCCCSNNTETKICRACLGLIEIMSDWDELLFSLKHHKNVGEFCVIDRQNSGQLYN